MPDYDNNKVNFLNEEQKFNKATKGIYELGSTLKIFTAAMALETGLINDKTLIDVSKPIKISSYTIKDHRPIKFSISLPEVIVHSSNIGSAKRIALNSEQIKLKEDEMNEKNTPFLKLTEEPNEEKISDESQIELLDINEEEANKLDENVLEIQLFETTSKLTLFMENVIQFKEFKVKNHILCIMLILFYFCFVGFKVFQKGINNL